MFASKIVVKGYKSELTMPLFSFFQKLYTVGICYNKKKTIILSDNIFYFRIFVFPRIYIKDLTENLTCKIELFADFTVVVDTNTAANGIKPL